MNVIIRIYGIVQGVGFRPFVSRTAGLFSLSGSVANKGSFVEIHAAGDREDIRQFIRQIKENPPERAVILNVEVTEVPKKELPEPFAIISSKQESGRKIFVSPDIAICPECQRELYDKKNKRYMHPFINCTSCGPRLTILEHMPYDRERTTMKKFPMCDSCYQEYTDKNSRRFDAQPVCCNHCGPKVYSYACGSKSAGYEKGMENVTDEPELVGKDAITEARKAINGGKIIAIKGIGGFHLCCDATNSAAVKRLRQLKHRPAKPFAVMMRNMEAVEKYCVVDSGEKQILSGYQKPIVLLWKEKDSHMAKEVAPGNERLGVMLPYAPLQLLLFDYDDGITLNTDALVMTSGNVSGAPICRSDQDVKEEISGFCDMVLSHDRDILLRADDSVMEFFQGEPYMIRRSRGYAPLPFSVGKNYGHQVLAAGGELKNAFCFSNGELFYLSPYIGDMEDIRTVQAFKESVRRMEELLFITPEVVACDMHPQYNSRQAAYELGLPVMEIQHHFAHVVSCMAENQYTGTVIGVAMDGTGYGTDGSIWGGELLVVNLNDFSRKGSITPFMQVGGDMAAKEGFRIAISMINQLYGDKGKEVAAELGLCSETEYTFITGMARQKVNTVVSTSAGRLFDSVSAILGLCRKSTFEGEAAIALQQAASRYLNANPEQETKAFKKECSSIFSSREKSSEEKTGEEKTGGEKICEEKFCGKKADKEKWIQMDTEEIVHWTIERVRKSPSHEGRNSAEALAYAFHVLLAGEIVRSCRKLRQENQISVCALSGGVFQNTLLLGLCKEALEKNGFRVLTHHLVPTNDGGIALGQAVIAQERLSST